MLRKAILQNWTEPSPLISKRQEQEATRASAKHVQQERDKVSSAAAVLDIRGEQQRHIRQASALEKKQLRQWYAASLEQKQAAYEQAVRSCDDLVTLEQINNSSDLHPHHAVLHALEVASSPSLVTP